LESILGVEEDRKVVEGCSENLERSGKDILRLKVGLAGRPCSTSSERSLTLPSEMLKLFPLKRWRATNALSTSWKNHLTTLKAVALVHFRMFVLRLENSCLIPHALETEKLIMFPRT